MAEEAVVTFEGGVGLASMIRQRWAHARRYGAGRSIDLGTVARLTRALACPIVPPLLLARIIAALRTRGMVARPWLPALPALAVLASAWALGEAVGTWRGPNGDGPGRRLEPRDGAIDPDRSPPEIVDEVQGREDLNEFTRRAG
jgi:hypothetical protein